MELFLFEWKVIEVRSLTYLFGFNFMYAFLESKNSKNIAIRPATTGRKTARIESPKEEPASTVEIAGFPAPPVVVVEVKRVILVPVCTIPAALLPAIIAKDHFAKGGNPLTTATIKIAPAINAAGVAIVSSRLSNQGM